MFDKNETIKKLINMRTDISQFSFERASSGSYNVTYTTKSRGDYYRAVVEDMPLIDKTLHEEFPTQKSLNELRLCVTVGSGKNKRHYSKHGERI